ncbi:MAG TPA: response regulator [Polyangiaceae bacterium]|jgi:CheY-like chemotaxis protein
MPPVLVVDDSAVVRRTIERRLQGEGLTVVADGSAAAARARDLTDVACILVDIELPDGSGCDLAKDLLARKPGVPVAFFTAGAAEDVLARARLLGPVFWKPDVEALVAWTKAAVQPPPTK